MKKFLRLWLYDFVMEINLFVEMICLIIPIYICWFLFAYEGVGKLFMKVLGVVIIVSTFYLAYMIPGWIGDKMALEVTVWDKLVYMIPPCIMLLFVIWILTDKE